MLRGTWDFGECLSEETSNALGNSALKSKNAASFLAALLQGILNLALNRILTLSADWGIKIKSMIKIKTAN